MKYLIANWKAYKTISEAKDWVSTFISKVAADGELEEKRENGDVKIIICPPAQYLAYLHEMVKEYPGIFIGAQDVSEYDEGKFTGEIPAKTLSGLASYAIVGHSERRGTFIETEEEIETKLSRANAVGIEPIHCVRGGGDMIYDFVQIVAFEPVEAIGTGQNMGVDEVLDIKSTMTLPEGTSFLYGGSVTKENCSEYLSSPEIDGLLIGSASLDPEHFYAIITYA